MTDNTQEVPDTAFETRQWIDAPIDQVWEYFTNPSKLMAWHGGAVEADPRPGGIWRCQYPDGAIIEGVFTQIEEPSHLIYTWGFAKRSERQVYDWARPNFTPPGQSVVEITLTEADGGTFVHLRHSGFEPGEPVKAGWGYFLDRLAGLFSDPGLFSDNGGEEV